MQISKEQIRQYRNELLPPLSVATEADCLAAVERLGFIWAFSPGTEELPALFPALATSNNGQRWDWAWSWKDNLSASHRAYYGRLVKDKPTLCSHAWVAVFYGLTGNTGDPEEDLLYAVEERRIGPMARSIHQYLLEHGATGTRTLQPRLTDGSKSMKKALEDGLHELDRAMLIAKVGAEGGNSIANVWDLFPRYMPQAVDQGTEMPTREAAVQLLRHYFTLTPAASRRSLLSLFAWGEEHLKRALARLQETGELVACKVEGQEGLRLATWAPA